MASIFTFDPDPPRVSSPWLSTEGAGTISGADARSSSTEAGNGLLGSVFLKEAAQSNLKVTHLQAEPQEGPVEYKLHLLLRPRRRFISLSTGSNVSGSRHSNAETQHQTTPNIVRSSGEGVVRSAGEDGVASGTTTPTASSTIQTRQHRLEQLTTQLLWRLKQSSPHHSSSATNIVLPSLPEALPTLKAPHVPAKLLHGLEESQGALYEIGVSDDGTLIGLSEDEMQESLNNLSAMAASLGCTVEVLREENVGRCEWLEDVAINDEERHLRRRGKLVVTEALVKPYLQAKSSAASTDPLHNEQCVPASRDVTAHQPRFTEQLRVTLTGATMSGKSSLLGTLTTSTLDNGRGKSRLSMLKHRHEINSGVTSSVTQELLGYADSNDGTEQVVNYAAENIVSWIDIHTAAEDSRLVFISDSAGHPRYRRTIVRGLVGWAPHWTLLCVPANSSEINSIKSGTAEARQQIGTSSIADMEVAGTQLELCLRLQLPLVIVITKLDLASKAGLKRTLTRVLDAIKESGRKPAIMANRNGEVTEVDLQRLEPPVIDTAYKMALPLLNDVIGTVPIVLTSALEGTGIDSLHALLHELPAPDPLGTPAPNSGFLFHIEDVFIWPTEVEGVIVSGILKSGQISLGETGTIGPFSIQDTDDSEDSDGRTVRRISSSLPTSRSFPGALRTNHMRTAQLQLPNQEWRRFRVTSVRNLRLPVQSLLADQVGTIAIVPEDDRGRHASADEFPSIRKGMVLASIQPQAARAFVAEFKREDLESLAVGNHVVVYISSLRAPARVVSARTPDSPGDTEEFVVSDTHGEQLSLGPDYAESREEVVQNCYPKQQTYTVTAPFLLVTLRFDTGREFVAVGDQVLVMPGGGPGLFGGLERGEKGLAGLEGFVGRVTEIS